MGGWLRRKPGYRSLDLNVGTICKFRIPRRPRASACFRAKARLMRVTSWQEDQQTWENCSWVTGKWGNLKGLMFQWAPNLLIGLRNHCYVQQKEDQLFVTEKNNERNQKLCEKWLVSEFNKNAKMVSKSSKHGKTLKPF